MESDKITLNIGWKFWVQWVLANWFGWLVGMGLSWLVSMVVSPLSAGPLRIIGWGVAGALVGSVMGISQYILLRSRPSLPLSWRASTWLYATILAWIFNLALISGFGLREQIGFALTGAIFGISIGISQWFVLQGDYNRAEWWAPVNTLGWMAGMGALDLLNQAVGFILVGAISGAITGIALLLLLQLRVRPGDELMKQAS